MTAATYTVKPVSEISADLMRDLEPNGKEWAIVRSSRIREQVWSFHTSEGTAKAAKRRNEARAIHTR